MKYNKFVALFLTASSLFFIIPACNNGHKKNETVQKTNWLDNDPKWFEEKSLKWFEETKTQILKQSNLKPDSLTYTYPKDGYKEEHFYSSRSQYRIKKYFQGKLYSEVHYSSSGDFELRWELGCDTVHHSFEGIFYKGVAYGLSIWRHCDGQIYDVGIRYKGSQIGKWAERDKKTPLIIVNDYGNENALDSMPQIK